MEEHKLQLGVKLTTGTEEMRTYEDQEYAIENADQDVSSQQNKCYNKIAISTCMYKQCYNYIIFRAAAGDAGTI